MSNEWPEGRPRAMSQAEHRSWNTDRFPGTREMCVDCGDPTGHCEEDNLFAGPNDDHGPLCSDCFNAAIAEEIERGEEGP